MTYIGSPFTFSTNLVNEGVGLVGPKASINAPDGVFWMDMKGFYFYNGAVAALPCSVHDYVFSDLNITQAYKVFGFLNKAFNEVGWYYCSIVMLFTIILKKLGQLANYQDMLGWTKALKIILEQPGQILTTTYTNMKQATTQMDRLWIMSILSLVAWTYKKEITIHL